jgi:hypothetical protein
VTNTPFYTTFKEFKWNILFIGLMKLKSHALRAGRVAQVVEHLPSKCETQSSNPSTNEKKKKDCMPGIRGEESNVHLSLPPEMLSGCRLVFEIDLLRSVNVPQLMAIRKTPSTL